MHPLARRPPLCGKYLPLPPPHPECATPSLSRWTMRFRNMNRRGGWPKPVFTTQCFEGTWEGRRRRGKVSGVFSLILSSFFSVFRFFFSFFFSRSRCKFLRLRFLLLLFSLFFFFRSLKKGFWGKRSRFVVIVDRVWLLYSIWAMILFFLEEEF